MNQLFSFRQRCKPYTNILLNVKYKYWVIILLEGRNIWPETYNQVKDGKSTTVKLYFLSIEKVKETATIKTRDSCLSFKSLTAYET